MKMLDNKRVLVTGGTGSLGRVLVRRLLSGEQGKPQKIIIFSRDEAKQHAMRVEYSNQFDILDKIVHHNAQDLLEFRVGDIRDFHSVSSVLRQADVVFSAAALKQVPTCEYFPFEAVQTNILGPENIVRAIRENDLPIEVVIGISTDKACKPVNVMGMTKAIQERIFIQANLECKNTRSVCVRYGNVLASRGSVIPLFHKQILNGGPITITTGEMTRFLLSLDKAVDTVFAALANGAPGETYVPRIPSANITDIASVLIDNRPIEIVEIGIRPGEKIHEIMVSEEEVGRTTIQEPYCVISSSLSELQSNIINKGELLKKEYSSADYLMSQEDVRDLLAQQNLLIDEKNWSKNGVPQSFY